MFPHAGAESLKTTDILDLTLSASSVVAEAGKKAFSLACCFAFMCTDNIYREKEEGGCSNIKNAWYECNYIINQT